MADYAYANPPYALPVLRPSRGDPRGHGATRLCPPYVSVPSFASCVLAASFAKRSARSRAALARRASCSASYSRNACAASRARCSFVAATTARCWASFTFVAIGISFVTTSHPQRASARGISGFSIAFEPGGRGRWTQSVSAHEVHGKKPREPANRARGSQTTSFASTSVVKAVWPPAPPIKRRADSQRQTCRSGDLPQLRTRASAPR
jgi:hypothetical protein